MNVRSEGTKVNRKQLIIFCLLALAVIYHFSRPTLEKWLGTSLPAISQSDEPDGTKEKKPDFNYEVSLPSTDSKSSNPTTSKGSTKPVKKESKLSPGDAARAWLKDIGGNKYQSPAGLIYTGGREHRIDHVLRHCVDDPTKPTHGVFIGDAVEVMRMVDEAYTMAKTGKGRVDSKKSDGKMTHTVSMGRVVGHTGGKKAERQGRKELRRIKLVLGDNRVITAFPTN